MTNKITLAVSKGRILEETLPMLEAINMAPLEDIHTTRKLLIDTQNPNVRMVIIRATDVPTYVQYGAADIGIAGKDILMETDAQGIHEMLDLNISKCKLMVAGQPEALNRRLRLRVATKYVNAAQQYFAREGKQVEIIKLYGSMELAPLAGLTDVIVDLVDTGKTLQANGLQPLAHIANISSRLVVNKASLKVRFDTLQQIINDFKAVVAER